MDVNARRPWASTFVRLAVLIAYPAAMIWIVPEGPIQVPALLIALGLPLILRLVPRNWLYGLRTSRTMRTTEEVWYRQNLIAGVAVVLIGAIWIAVVALR